MLCPNRYAPTENSTGMNTRLCQLKNLRSTRRVFVVFVGRVMPDEEVEAVRLVEERLIVGSTAVDRIEVEPRGAEVDQGIRVIVALEFRRRIEREVVVDELSEVGEPRRDVGIVATRVLVTRFRLGLHHLLGECGEGPARGKELRPNIEHAPEPALRKRRPGDGFLASDCMPMERVGW